MIARPFVDIKDVELIHHVAFKNSGCAPAGHVANVGVPYIFPVSILSPLTDKFSFIASDHILVECEVAADGIT